VAVGGEANHGAPDEDEPPARPKRRSRAVPPQSAQGPERTTLKPAKLPGPRRLTLLERQLFAEQTATLAQLAAGIGVARILEKMARTGRFPGIIRGIRASIMYGISYTDRNIHTCHGHWEMLSGWGGQRSVGHGPGRGRGTQFNPGSPAPSLRALTHQNDRK
jgi:hypothetical protein